MLAGANGLLVVRAEPPFPYPQYVNEAVRRLIRFYETTERPSKAEEWRKIGEQR